ncbi:MAG TPA: hypothetical protein VIL35_12165 [Vicinamibacterales bacterium]
MRTRVLTLVAALALAGTASGQTIDELVAKNLEAKGGVERLKAVKAMRISGTVSVAPGMEIPMTIMSERPNKLRQESSFQGQQTVVAFDGQKAWTINPMMGASTPREITGPQFDMLREQADLDGPLVDYKAKGVTLELLGTEEVEGRKTHKLKVTRKSGQSQTLFLDAETGLEVKAVNEMPQGDVTLRVESTFSDYRTIEGIKMAHAIRQTISGPASQTITITVNKAEILPDLEDSLFTMPSQ